MSDSKPVTFCLVCRQSSAGTFLCKRCQKSYDKHLAENGAAIVNVIQWAANRARNHCLKEEKARQEFSPEAPCLYCDVCPHESRRA